MLNKKNVINCEAYIGQNENSPSDGAVYGERSGNTQSFYSLLHCRGWALLHTMIVRSRWGHRQRHMLSNLFVDSIATRRFYNPIYENNTLVKIDRKWLLFANKMKNVGKLTCFDCEDCVFESDEAGRLFGARAAAQHHRKIERNCS